MTRRTRRTAGSARRQRTIDGYVSAFPKRVCDILNSLRATIRRAAPRATEAMKYGIPTFTLNGNLVHFAAFAHHIGFYPTPSAIRAFASELAPYRRAKGSVRFPIDQPMPLALIRRIVTFRVTETRARAKRGPRRRTGL